MNKSLQICICLIVFSLLSTVVKAQLFPNPGFENWTSMQGIMEPDGWTSSNFPPTPSVVQCPGHTGTYGIRLNTVVDPNGGPLFGGQIDCFSAINIKPLTISGYWKYNNAGTVDGIFIDMNVYTQSTVVGTLTAHTPGASLPNWTAFSANVNYGLTTFPDYFNMTIRFFPSSTSSLNGYGQVDDLAFTYIAGIKDTITAQFPAANLIHGSSADSYNLLIDILSKENMTAQVYDLQGKLIQTLSKTIPAGHYEFPLELSTLKAGEYIYHVTLGQKAHSFRIQKMD